MFFSNQTNDEIQRIRHYDTKSNILCVMRKPFACHALTIVYHHLLFAKEHMGILNP